MQVLRKPSMNLLTDFYIFETIPKEQRAPGKVGWWSSVQQGKQVPFAFARALRLTADVVLVGLAVLKRLQMREATGQVDIMGSQGMRERAQALGGQVEAGSVETGGFAVSLSFPYERSGEQFAQKGRRS